ncbi:hypothetical protein Hanom_Chr06g00547681 [Helianthus anomalus]
MISSTLPRRAAFAFPIPSRYSDCCHKLNYHLFLKEVVIQQIISRRQIDETTIDPLELLKNLKGWTVKKYKCTETNGRYRGDKVNHSSSLL